MKTDFNIHVFFKVYPGTLENVEEFGNLTDFLDTFPLVRGKKKKRPDDDDEEVGEFKVRCATAINRDLP